MKKSEYCQGLNAAERKCRRIALHEAVQGRDDSASAATGCADAIAELSRELPDPNDDFFKGTLFELDKPIHEMSREDLELELRITRTEFRVVMTRYRELLGQKS